MAEFLTTNEINARIDRIINGAQERVVLVSPYLRIGQRLQSLIADKNRLKVEMRLIYGKSELSLTEIEWLSKLQFLRTSFSPNLHAKCYYNEQEALITSMNLYEHSQVNNDEFGIAFTKNDDPDLYEKMRTEVDRIYRNSRDITLTVQEVEKKEETKPQAAKPNSKPTSSLVDKAKAAVKAITGQGYCIRCGTSLPRDPEHPYCRSCYGEWKKQGGDSLSHERQCHWCGKPNKSTLEKPVCYDCYKKHLK